VTGGLRETRPSPKDEVPETAPLTAVCDTTPAPRMRPRRQGARSLPRHPVVGAGLGGKQLQAESSDCCSLFWPSTSHDLFGDAGMSRQAAELAIQFVATR